MLHRLGCEPCCDDPFFDEGAVVSKEEWHFTGNSTGREGWNTSVVDGGSAAYLNPADPAMPGAMELEATAIGGPSGNDEASFFRLVGGVFGFGVGSPKTRLRRIIRHDQAPDGADDYGMRVGVVNGFAYTGSSAWVALEANFGLYGPNWQLLTRDGGGITNVDTGLTVLSTVGAPLAVELQIEADGALVRLLLNGVPVAQTAAVPVANLNMSSSFQIAKFSGSNLRNLICDYASEEFQLPAAFAA